MKNFKKLIVLALFVSLFNACSKEENIVDPINNTPLMEEEEVLGIQSMIQVAIDGEEPINFNFDECAFNDAQKQRTTNSYGTSGNSKNIKGLATRIYNRNEAGEIETELLLKASFVNEISEGEIDIETIESILNSHPIAESSPFFGLEIGIRKEGEFFTNIKSRFDDTGNIMFQYTPDFEFEVKEYEIAYESECLDKELIRLEIDFNGLLYDYESGELVDSLNVEILDLELLLIVE